MTFYGYRKQAKQEKEFTIEDIYKDMQCFRFFCAIYFNRFQFEKKLIEEYNLTKSQIQKYSEKLSEMGLIVFRIPSEDNIIEELIMRLNFCVNINRREKIYCITPRGMKEGKVILDEAIKNNLGNESFFDFLNQVRGYSKNVLELLNTIKFEENTQFVRKIPIYYGNDQVVIERETKASKNLKLLVSNNKNQLVDKKYDLVDINKDATNIRQNKYIYKGMFEHLSDTERINMSQDKAPEIKLSREEKKYYKDLDRQRESESYHDIMSFGVIKALTPDSVHVKSIQGFNKAERDKIFNDGMNYLNSLSLDS